MNWQGSVLAPETGEYEFVVRTENAIAALGQRQRSGR